MADKNNNNNKSNKNNSNNNKSDKNNQNDKTVNNLFRDINNCKFCNYQCPNILYL